MLIRTGRSRRSSFAELVENQQRITSAAEGREVMVLAAGVYNGPNNKSLGWCEASAVIRVAVGAYADSLIRDGLVAAYDSNAPVADDDLDLQPEPANAALETPEPAPEPPVEPMPWRAFLEAGLTEKAARAVWEGGCHTADDILGKWAEAGLEGLTTLPGVGSASARKLVVWAGVPVEDLA